MTVRLRWWPLFVFLLVVICFVLLGWIGNAEPALPRCPIDRPAHVECRP